MKTKKNPKGAGRKPIDENRRRKRIALSISSETYEFLSMKNNQGRFIDELIAKTFPSMIGEIRERLGVKDEQEFVPENNEGVTPESFADIINSSVQWSVEFNEIISRNGWIDDTIECGDRICHGEGFAVVYEDNRAVVLRRVR